MFRPVQATQEAFIPTFAMLKPELVGMLAAERSLESKKIAIFIFDDFVEYVRRRHPHRSHRRPGHRNPTRPRPRRYTTRSASPYAADFLPALLTYLEEPS